MSASIPSSPLRQRVRRCAHGAAATSPSTAAAPPLAKSRRVRVVLREALDRPISQPVATAISDMADHRLAVGEDGSDGGRSHPRSPFAARRAGPHTAVRFAEGALQSLDGLIETRAEAPAPREGLLEPIRRRTTRDLSMLMAAHAVRHEREPKPRHVLIGLTNEAPVDTSREVELEHVLVTQPPWPAVKPYWTATSKFSIVPRLGGAAVGARGSLTHLARAEHISREPSDRRHDRAAMIHSYDP